MRKNSLVVLLFLSIIFVNCPLIAMEETRVNVMVLSGTTGLSLVKMLEEKPTLVPKVTIDYTVIKSPDQMVAKIVSGDAQIAALPTNLASILYNRGLPIQLAAITNWGVMYIVGQDTGISSWQDLKGKEIGVTGKGSTPDLLFRYFLSANGLDPEKDVQIQYYPTPAELAQLTIAGKVRLATLPEPWVTEVVKREPSFDILLDYQKEWQRLEGKEESYPQSSLVVNTKLVQENPGFVKEFLKAASASSTWVVNNPKEAGRLAQKHLFISSDAALDAIPRCNLRFIEGYKVKEEVEYFLEKLLSFQPKSIGGKLPNESFYLQK